MNMVISINLKEIALIGLSPTEYCFLVSLYKQFDYIGTLTEQQQDTLFKSLENKGFLKITAEGVILRQTALDLMSKDSSPLLVDNWIEEWRNLFPTNIKSGGRPIKGDKKACIRKMTAFLKEYPEYSKEDIFQATRIYIFDKKRDNYNYMVCADYFIYKDKVSLLASILEDIDGKQTTLQMMENGNNPFQKEI